MVDIIIIGVIGVCVVLSILYMVKRKKAGQSGCGCDCNGCETSGCSTQKNTN
ncbi:FeoB-associated Cys-rich membrane protein [Tissierella pigra]|uniref:FeoB-associated Cys-rich membrane protein n=1 Tax=Tissierella pigra TaxID=2607614 RepID=A0A6N7XWN7_9FIRM|nr:FeoB-associated Cys-rich membrane protein [Tissierella pigra]MBU5424828.1 FeoB-associated Cys-rich membrane protein [Tissierella pigra]MSU02227.1 FeoB-associated Cys-rich membrane protein [Tissierella pigra]